MAQRRYALINRVAVNNGSLPTLSDVTITAAAAGDLLMHNGTAWVDATTLTGNYTLNGTVSIPEATVTAHEAALTILESQITDGSVLARVAGTETITGAWEFQGGVTVTSGNIVAGTVDADFGAVTATSYGGITEANLLDLTAAETIQGIWLHSARTKFFTYQSGSSTTAIQFHAAADVSDVAPYGIGMGPTGSVGIVEYSSGTSDSSAYGHKFIVNGTDRLVLLGDATCTITAAVTATSYGGITEANLVDKTAAETITALWAFDDKVSVLTDINTSSPPTTEAVTGYYQITDQAADDDLLQLGYTEGSNGAYLRNLMRGGIFALTVKNSSGTNRTPFEANPDSTTIVRAATNFALYTATTDQAISCIANAQVDLAYNGNIKLTTTNTGVNITGALSATSTAFPAGVQAQGNVADAGLSGVFAFMDVQSSTTVRFGAYNWDTTSWQPVRVDGSGVDIMANTANVDLNAASGQININGTTVVTGTLTATSYGGITEANLVDKSAAETISGAWNFTAAPSFLSGVTVKPSGATTQLYFNDAADTLKWRIGCSGDATDDFIIYDSDSAKTVISIDDSTNAILLNDDVDINGALTATMIGGITEANLLNKASDEAVTGRWDFHNALSYGFAAGINGNYSSTGNSASWGGTIWGLDTAFDGATAANDSADTALYGLKWKRASHANAHATVGEGLYIHQNANRYGGIGAGGMSTEVALYMKERAAASGDTAAYGQLWVKTATPCELWFTDDAGTDTQIV